MFRGEEERVRNLLLAEISIYSLTDQTGSTKNSMNVAMKVVERTYGHWYASNVRPGKIIERTPGSRGSNSNYRQAGKDAQGGEKRKRRRRLRVNCISTIGWRKYCARKPSKIIP